MLSLLILFVQRIYHHLQVLFIPEEVGIGGINKNCFQIMLPDIVRICFLDVEQVFIRDVLFIGTFPFAYVLLQLAHRRMQVDNDIGLDQLLVHDLEKALVQTELVFCQGHF